MAVIRSAIQLQDRMTPVLRGITNALNVTISSFEALQRVSHNSVDTASLAVARRELANAEVTINQVEQEIREANNAQQQFNGSVRSGGYAMDGLVGKVRSLASAYLGVKAVKAGIESTDNFINNQARLGLIVDVDDTAVDATQQKIQATADLQNEIYAAAQRSRGEYGKMVDNVAKLGLLAGDAFNDTSEIVTFTETMQKAFKVSGASTQEATNAMYQLNQAMASGRLQGDEYRSIIENAPMLANALADYCGVARGELKELSSDGALTSDVIKGAVFNMAQELETQFQEMPMTFSDVWTQIKNTASKESQDVMQRVNNALNSNHGEQVIQGITNSIVTLIQVLGIVIELSMSIGAFFVDNWSWIEPIIWGIVGAFGAYNAILFVYNTYKAITIGLETLHAARAAISAGATLAEAAATTTATGAQVGLNAALLACPITWIIVAIIALITIIYAVVGAINKITGTSISATGVIMGAVFTASAFVWNIIMGVINAILQIINTVANIIISVVEWILNICTGGFNSFGDAVANLIGNIISWFLNLGEVVTKIIDAIFGTNWTAGLESLSSAVQAWGKNDKAITLDRWDYQVNARLGYSDAYKQGYNIGTGIDEKVSSFMPKVKESTAKTTDYSDMINGLGEGIGDTADNTGKISDSLKTTEEDLKYLRDIAEQETINRFTTAEIKVDMGGVSNVVYNNQDLDGIVDYLRDKIEEEMQIAAEGVHE